MRRFLTALCVFCAINFAASDFIEPTSAKGDFYESYNVGDTINIQWNSGWTWGKGDQPNSTDLFIMWFDNPTDYSQLVLANVSLATSGNYSWKIDVVNDIVANEQKFVFRFSQHTDPPIFNTNNPKMPSRGFILAVNATSDSSSSTVTRTAASTASSSQSSSTSISSSSGMNTPAQGKSSSNTAAIAGGVLGGLVGLALICGAVLIVLRRMRKRKEQPGEWQAEKVGGGEDTPVEMYAHTAQELPTPPTELSGNKIDHSAELHGSTPRDWH